jgi:hypothetical protein
MKHARFRSLLVCAAALTLVATVPAAAQEEGEAVKSILGNMGIIPKDPPRIDYRERAPLVVPPQMDLPPPVDPKAVEARANWPRDPDVTAARREAKEAAKRYEETDYYRMNRNSRLSIEELRGYGRRPDAKITTPYRGPSEKSRLEPDELRTPAQLAGRASEPLERRYLSDPPSNLLQPAPGAPMKATAEPRFDPAHEKWMGR